MNQNEYDAIVAVSPQTKSLIDQMVEEMEVSQQMKETYREFMLLNCYRERNSAALAMMEYLNKKVIQSKRS